MPFHYSAATGLTAPAFIGIHSPRFQFPAKDKSHTQAHKRGNFRFFTRVVLQIGNHVVPRPQHIVVALAWISASLFTAFTGASTRLVGYVGSVVATAIEQRIW